MSEHFCIEGHCEFWHLPEDEPWGMAFCNRCKKIKSRLIVEFHQGISNDWIKVKCFRCKKTMWVAELTTPEEDGFGGGRRIVMKDDRKCFICKKPTNQWDCYCLSFVGKNNRMRVICSDKCNKKYVKYLNDKYEKD